MVPASRIIGRLSTSASSPRTHISPSILSSWSTTMTRQLRSSTKAAASLPSTAEAPTEPPPKSVARTKPSGTRIITPGDPVSVPDSHTPEIGEDLSPTDPPSVLFSDDAAFATYIAANPTSTGTWLLLCKKSAPTRTITYDAAVLVALCNGWIDGQRKSLPSTTHPHHFVQRFTPRRRGSLWSARNVGLVEGLVAQGRMLEAGLLEVQRAKDDGRWERAYKGSKDMEASSEFLERIEKVGGKRAMAFWEGLTKSKRYGFLWRLETAKREETKLKRMNEFAALLAEGKTL